jgi:hypothetical protein
MVFIPNHKVSSAMTEINNFAARELGGPVKTNVTYMVGEKGPELFTAAQATAFPVPGSNFLASEGRFPAGRATTGPDGLGTVDGVVRGSTSSNTSTINHVKPSITINHNGSNMTDDDVVAAVRKGVRRGTLSLA